MTRRTAPFICPPPAAGDRSGAQPVGLPTERQRARRAPTAARRRAAQTLLQFGGIERVGDSDRAVLIVRDGLYEGRRRPLSDHAQITRDGVPAIV